MFILKICSKYLRSFDQFDAVICIIDPERCFETVVRVILHKLQRSPDQGSGTRGPKLLLCIILDIGRGQGEGRERAGRGQGEGRERAGKVQGRHREGTGKVQGRYRAGTGKVQGRYREGAGKVQGRVREGRSSPDLR